MNRTQKAIQKIIWGIIVCLSCYILIRGIGIISDTSIISQAGSYFERASSMIYEKAAETFLPAMVYSQEEKTETISLEYAILERVFSAIPLYDFLSDSMQYTTQIEDAATQGLIMAAEGYEEGYDEDTLEQNAAKENAEAVGESETNSEEVKMNVKESTDEGVEVVTGKAIDDLTLEKLSDFNYLLNNFYTVAKATTVDSELLDASKFLSKDLTIEKDNSVPQILIYHTHSQEAFVDSIEGDPSTTIVGVGAYLAEILEEEYGYQVIHHTGVYDLVDGVLDRNNAYDLSGEAVSKILEENPSIEVVIDLHRDGVDGKKFVTEINGKPTARIMLFNGISRSAKNGEISYLYNENRDDNLAFSFQLQLMAAEYYPGWTRNIYINAYRYNLHLMPRALLVESGTQLNTVEEEMNAMEPLAEMLDKVLSSQ